MSPPKIILVPTDFSDSAKGALEYAVALAGKLDAKISLLNAMPVPGFGVPELGFAVSTTVTDEIIRANHGELDKLAARYLPVKIETILRNGDARDTILEVAKEIGAELIVMGTHGRRGVKRALLGSVAESVVRTATCPVLTVRKAAAS